MICLNVRTSSWARAAILVATIALLGCSSPVEKAKNYTEQGSEFLVKKDYVKAGIEFRNAIQLNKSYLPAWQGLLQVETENKNVSGMIAALKTIVELDPKDIKAALQLGHYLLAGNALDQASKLADAAVDVDPKSAGAHAFKGAVLLKQGDRAGAEKEGQLAFDLDPNYAESLIVLAGARMNGGDIAGALAVLQQHSSSASENDLGVQIMKLALYERLGDTKKVENILRKLTEDHPQESAFRKTLVSLYLRQKRFDEALDELRRVAVLRPNDVEAGLDVVRLIQATKGPQAAREELVSHIAQGVEKFRYQMALADFDFGANRTTDAISSLKNMIQNSNPENKVAAQVKLAGFELALGHRQEAEILVGQVLEKDKRNTEGLRIRASLRLDQGNTDAAISDLREALNDQPRNKDLIQILASAYERAGNVELSEKQFADAVNISNYDPTAALNYVNFLRRRGNLDRALDVLAEVLRRHPADIGALRETADIRLAKQDWSGADQIAQTIRAVGGNATVLADEITAASLNGRGKYDESIDILQSVVKSKPGATPPLVSLIGTLAKTRQYDRAVTVLQDVLSKQPNNAQIYVLLGGVLNEKGQAADALRNYQEAIDKQPALPVGYLSVANLYTQQNKLDDAEAVLRSGLSKSTNDSSLRMALAGLLETKGSYEQAIAEYETLLKSQPGSLIVINNLASLLAERRTDKESLERAFALASTLRKSPIPAFKDTLGWIYYLRGDFKSGVPLLEEAAMSLSNRSSVQYHLGMLYLANGQAPKASERFKKALGLQPDKQLETQIKAAQEKAAI